MKKHLLIATCGLALALSAGVASAQVSVGVRVGPPPPRHEVIVRPTGHPDWVLRHGYYRHDGTNYVWVPGEYVAPPHARAHWIEGRWERRNGQYFWVEGHWR